MPTSRSSARHLAPTATHAMSVIQYSARSQRYAHAQEIAPSITQFSPLILHFFQVRCGTSASCYSLFFVFVCRLTLCWSLNSAAHLWTIECKWSSMHPGRCLQRSMHAHALRCWSRRRNRSVSVMHRLSCSDSVEREDTLGDNSVQLQTFVQYEPDLFVSRCVFTGLIYLSLIYKVAFPRTKHSRTAVIVPFLFCAVTLIWTATRSIRPGQHLKQLDQNSTHSSG